MLPIFNTPDQILSMLQTKWASELNPLLTNPILSGVQLKRITLATGANSINHKLGRKLQGWIITRWIGSSASVYDTQDSNSMPELTLNLTSSGTVSVDIYVY